MSKTSTSSALPGFSLPELSRDFDFFVEGLRQRQLLVQRCKSCDTVRHPPGPVCPSCGSFEWSTEALKGTGTVYSYVVHYHPPIPPYTTPHPVVLVDMDEGQRVLAALDGCPVEQIAIGMRVQLEFVDVAENFTLHRFRPEGK